MRKGLRFAILILSAVVFFSSVGVLLYYWHQDRSDKSVREQVADLFGKQIEGGDEGIPPEFQALYAENPDTVGWLRIDGTNVDGVVMHAPDTLEKYLHTDFNGQYSARGMFYVAEKNDMLNSDNIIIYGHHMNDGTMFGQLELYQDAAYGAAHSTIVFNTIYGYRTYQLVAAIRTRVLADWEPGFKYYEYTGHDDVQFWEYVDFIQNNRLYDTGVELQPGDRLLTLSTCAYHETDGRFIIIAKQVS